MENISPVIFFIIYLALSAWAKNRKAQAKKAPPPPPSLEQEVDPEAEPAKGFGVGSIFEQIKQELLDLEEDAKIPLPVQPVEQVVIPEPVEVKPEPKIEVRPFSEGSTTLEDHRISMERMTLDPDPDGKSGTAALNSVLENYSRIEQGIILKEILGEPRARQDQDEWFHKY